jgi:FAD/FMN-containing dehydrogenase
MDWFLSSRKECIMVTSIQHLQQQVTGSLLLPGDALYEQTRRGWNLSIDHHPALILVANDAQDIIAGLGFAREAGLGVAVQLTGHGIQHPADDSLLIVTSPMASVHIDAEARTARVEAGAIWAQVLDPAAEYGLAPLLGTSPHVGVVGYTLGGGIGWLARRYGFAGDSVRWIDIVTADGVLRHASPTEHSDLFWGLRGGGGNFGVVTAMAFDLYPVATIYGGNLVYPGGLAGDALRFYRDWITTAPDELTSSIAILKYPPLPELPEALRGKTLVIVRAAFAGGADDGAARIQPWLDWRTPISNTFHAMPFAEIGTINNDPVDPRATYGSNEMLDDLSDAAIDVIVGYATDSASPLVFNELRHAAGAIARVDADANAIGNRDALLYFQIGGLSPNPEARAGIEAYIQRYKRDLHTYLRGGVYLNFMIGGEARRRTKDAYLPETYQRLITLKAKYDPNNLFRFSYQL